MISQHQVLEIDEIGNPFLVLGVVDLSPDQKDMDEIKFRLVNNKTGEMTPFPLTEETNIKLTKREVEILKLVNKGMFSKEISDSLSISIHTVNNHRQNILQKMNTDNVVEAINYARKLGLLD
ncbi:helix-turn-helix domain-containing protein [Bacteroides xylanisolvens]|uniref:helix-turn-helix domain-containing protein n=1 Tax=Bacteroides xylanisolvens TaxID=371601 RepID=UPI0039B4522B